MTELLDSKVTMAGLSALGIYVVGLKGVNSEGQPFTVYDEPFIVPELECKGFVTNLLNSPNSPYYFSYKDKFLFEVGTIDMQTMEVKTKLVPEVIATLESYIKPSLRKYQQTLQTLNFLPSGYYRIPKEQKEEIQKDIDEAILRYVEDYVIPEIDVTKIDKSSDSYKNSINDILALAK